MRLFWEIMRRSFRRFLTYRAAMLAGLVTNLFFGLLRASVLLALAGNGQGVIDNAGFDQQNIITYTALTQAVIAFLSVFGSNDLMQTVYRGEIANDLLKPLSLFQFWLAQDLGRALATLLMRGVTILLIYRLFYPITVPQSLTQWLLMMLSFAFAFIISFGFRFLVNLMAFWSPDARGIGRLAFALSMFASGFLMPLAFFPPVLQQILAFTPFPAMINTPMGIYMGTISGPAIQTQLLLQAFWAVTLVVVAQIVLRQGSKRLVILGG
jgi:ABC-2 type transport system permease protein